MGGVTAKLPGNVLETFPRQGAWLAVSRGTPKQMAKCSQPKAKKILETMKR